MCLPPLGVGLLSSCWPAGVFAEVWLERGENIVDPNQECPSRSTVNEKGIVMTMIGIDPHKATHTAVAIDDDENVIDEFTLEASKDQVERLTAWADQFAKREWAVESANGLGYLIARQPVACGEAVFDVPPVLASRVWLMGSVKSQKNDVNGHLLLPIDGQENSPRTATVFPRMRSRDVPRRFNLVVVSLLCLGWCRRDVSIRLR
jgi:hypothetical protein